MPLKISLELSDATPKEIDALICFLTVCHGGSLATEEKEEAPEAAFTLTPAPSPEPVKGWGPTLVAPPPPAAPNPPAAPANANAPATGANSAASASPATDKSGLPWDERIHASTRALTADGLWRKKRGVDEATVKAAEDQLRQVMNIPAPAVAAPPPPPPASVPAATASAGPSFQDKFVNLITRASAAIAANKVTQAQIQECANAAGLPNVQMLFNRPDLFDTVAAAIGRLIGD